MHVIEGSRQVLRPHVAKDVYQGIEENQRSNDTKAKALSNRDRANNSRHAMLKMTMTSCNFRSMYFDSHSIKRHTLLLNMQCSLSLSLLKINAQRDRGFLLRLMSFHISAREWVRKPNCKS